MRTLLWIGFVPLMAVATVEVGTPATLLRWEDRGEVAVNRGPGQPVFRMVAVISWDASASRDPNRYAVRVTLPDGGQITHSLEVRDTPPSPSITVLVPADRLRDFRPEQVTVKAEVIDSATGAAVSNSLEAGIDDFSNPGQGESDEERGPFGWGVPVRIASPGAALIPSPAPNGQRFVRVRPGGTLPGFTLALSESSVDEVRKSLKDYDPRSGRSDDFRLEDGSQPAVALSPARARSFLDALGKTNPSGPSFRLPTEEEWNAAAKAGKPTAFWWGDQPTFPQGANFLGPEPVLAIDTTAPAVSTSGQRSFEANPWGLFHTFGNAAEWATRTDGSFVRLGGHFRTDATSPLPAESVTDENSTGPDPYVGVRPVLELTEDRGAEIARSTLGNEKTWERVQVAFDPDRCTVTLTGSVPATSDRKLADRRLSGLWFVSAVDNRIEGPGVPAGLLANLDSRIVARKRKTPLGKTIDELTVPVRWSPRLPVEGSHWFVNVFSPQGVVFSHPMIGGKPDPRRPLVVAVDRGTIGFADTGVRVALSLGTPAATPTDASVVSNVMTLK